MEIIWNIQVLASVIYGYIDSPTNYIREEKNRKKKKGGNEPTVHVMQLEIDQ